MLLPYGCTRAHLVPAAGTGDNLDTTLARRTRTSPADDINININNINDD
jgi:hypothetical protein